MMLLYNRLALIWHYGNLNAILEVFLRLTRVMSQQL